MIVAVRPERLEVGVAGGEPAATDVRTMVAGRIHQGTYLGDQTEFRVHTDAAGELVVRRQNEAAGGAHLGLAPGDPVTVSWSEDANLVLVA